MRNFAVGLFLAAAAGCGTEPNSPPEVGALEPQVGLADPGTPVDALSECTGERIECVIRTDDGSGLVARLSYGEAQADNTSDVIVNILRNDGQRVQDIVGFVEGTVAPPTFDDLDADGADELLLPVMTGNVNSVFSVWRRGADDNYTLMGEISGVSFEPVGDGLFSTSARSSAASWEVGYHRFTETGVELVVLTAIELAESPDGGEPIEMCAAMAGPGFASLGITDMESQQRFCGVTSD